MKLHPNKLGGFDPLPPSVDVCIVAENYGGSAMFSPAEAGYRQVSEHWCLTRDGNSECYAMYRRHYSSRKNRRPKQRQFVGPGESLVLIADDGSAIFVWRKEVFRQDSQVGVNCSIFRNEGGYLSSDLIKEACSLAWVKWPGQRLFTFVDASQVRHKRDPGRCFKKAGWVRDGETKGGLLVFAIRTNTKASPSSDPTEVGGFQGRGLL